MELLPENGEVLDLGCGSGRDTLFLEEEGFSVTAMDGSKRMCELAEIHTGRDVLHLRVEDMEFDDDSMGSGHVPCWDTLRQIRFMKCWGKFWMP